MGIKCKNPCYQFRIENKIINNCPTGKNAGKNGLPIKNNNMVYIKAGKGPIHRYGLPHKSAHVIIINSKNEILLQLRGEGKTQWPNYWDIIGEHYSEEHKDIKNTAKIVYTGEIGGEMPNPIITFYITDTLYYNVKTRKAENKEDIIGLTDAELENIGPIKTDNETRYVFVVLTNHITDVVVESLNEELGRIEKEKRETVKYGWFSKEKFNELLDSSMIVPYTYWDGCKEYKTFREFFKTKAQELTRGDDEPEIK